MIKVRTEQELKAALKAKEPTIVATGPLAEKMHRRTKTKKAAKIAGIALIAASAVAIPFTFGASAAGIAAGAAGLTIGTLTMTTAELAIICGFALGTFGIYKGSKVEFKMTSEGPEVIINPNYKE